MGATPAAIVRYTTSLKTRSVGPHAYTMLLGLKCFDFPGVMSAMKKGFPWTAFERLARNMNIPQHRLAEMIRVSRRTLARRKAEKRFEPRECERLLRIARVFGEAVQLFDGDRDAATDWLTHSNRVLGGVSPLELARTDIGAIEVEHLIERIEHGVYS